jgi:hypothetical protein
MNANESIFQKLKSHFENTPEEELRKEWAEFDKYNKIGPTVEEYFSYVAEISPEHKAVIERHKNKS